MSWRNFREGFRINCRSPWRTAPCRSAVPSRAPCSQLLITLIAATILPLRLTGSRCSVSQRHRYCQRLLGQLLDRLDLQLRLEQRSAKKMAAVLKQPSPIQAASWCNPARIQRARQRMQRRNPGGDSNGGLSAAALRQSGTFEAAALELWEQLINQRGLSSRSSLQLLRVASTIADLNNRTSVNRNAVAEASCFRCTDPLKQPGAQKSRARLSGVSR